MVGSRDSLPVRDHGRVVVQEEGIVRVRGLVAVLIAIALPVGCSAPEQLDGAPPPQDRPVPEQPGPDPSDDANSGGDGAVPDDSVEFDSSPTIERIKQRGKLLVGVRNDAEEFAQRGSGGDYSGFDVEIARDLAVRMGLQPQQIQFRRLPPTLLTDAVSSGNVDLLLGGTADSPDLAEAGPYAVAGEPRSAVVSSDDPALVGELERMFDESVADGTWQRIYDGTLADRGIEARPR